MDAINPAKGTSSSLVEFDPSEPLKALGVSWDSTSYHFRFLAPSEITPWSNDKEKLAYPAIKRFDPVVLSSPLTVRAKILFQELWLKELQWDGSEIKAN